MRDHPERAPEDNVCTTQNSPNEYSKCKLTSNAIVTHAFVIRWQQYTLSLSELHNYMIPAEEAFPRAIPS
jgi:hypothetical protein